MMTVRVRPRQSERPARRQRGDSRTHAPVRAPQRPAEPTITADSGEGRARERGPLQDHAIYSCQCGYVFQAAVSTTVGCPHCGGDQAW